MNKEEKLDKLDGAVLDKMLEWIESDDTDRLPELNVAVQYLSKNSVVAEKKVSTREEEIKRKVTEAKKRRNKNEDTKGSNKKD